MHANSFSSRSAIFFSIGFFSIGVVAIALFIASTVLFLGKTIAPWQFPLAVVASLGLNYVVFGRRTGLSRRSQFGLFLGIPLALVLCSIWISGCFYDITFDGQAYHQEAIIQLEAGWNPYRQYLPDTVNQAIWVNHYAKGMEMVQSMIYATFQDIEMGKSVNLLLWIASVSIVLVLLQHLSPTLLRRNIFLSILISSSPVVFNQLLTYYVDGALSSCLLILIATLILVHRQPHLCNWLLLAFVIVILANIKFTGVVYIVLFVGAFSAWYLTRRRQKTFYRLLAVAVPAGLLAILIGYNPYITNFIDYGHPLHPLMGAHKVDIMDINTPYGFKGKSEVERFFISLFAHTENLYPWNRYDIALKIPFTFNTTDLANAPKVDTRLAGFGPFFSGIVVLTIIIGFIIAKHVKKSKRYAGIAGLVAIIVLSVVIMPESWWARYVPQLWFLPFVLLIGAEILLKRKPRTLLKVIYIAYVLNFMFYLPNILMIGILTGQTNYQMRVFQAAEKPVIVDWGASQSNRIRFIEWEIPYREVDDLASYLQPDTRIAYLPGSQARFIKSPADDEAVEKALWLRVAERWMPNTWKHY